MIEYGRLRRTRMASYPGDDGFGQCGQVSFRQDGYVGLLAQNADVERAAVGNAVHENHKD
ncbi:hypothetical protein Z951_15815 [Streptomyces sp. PRh5]|nr:hypothetical protein Z951_15815 [Streptomyces sp. PRh5]